MVSCADFLRDFSEYRDGYLDPAGRAALEAHRAGCSACARYARVMEEGVEELRALPVVEPSYDFMARLQHRLYNLEEDRARMARREGAGVSAMFVAVLVVLIAVAAWWPQRSPRLAVVELPPVVAVAPKKPEPIHALFRPGPLLTQTRDGVRFVSPASNAVFFRYAPLGTYPTYPLDANRPR